jgi:hypothetical protein
VTSGWIRIAERLPTAAECEAIVGVETIETVWRILIADIGGYVEAFTCETLEEFHELIEHELVEAVWPGDPGGNYSWSTIDSPPRMSH